MTTNDLQARSRSSRRAGLRDFHFSRIPRRGFTRVSLVLAIAIFALVSLLAGIQAGDIDLAGMLPAGKSAKKAAKPQNPLLLASPAPSDAAAEDPTAAAEAAVPTEPLVAAVPEGALRIDGRTRQLICRAFGRMDPVFAAERLTALNDNDATLVLSCQKRRDLAFILESSEPAVAANWVNILLQMDDAQQLLPPGESILDQVNESLDAAPPAEADNLVQPTAGPAVAMRPDFMLSPEEHAAFLAQFPQYRADTDTARGSVIPVISDFELTD
ncbi:MAG: hypothetical protein R3F46_10205 [bacterium]